MQQHFCVASLACFSINSAAFPLVFSRLVITSALSWVRALKRDSKVLRRPLSFSKASTAAVALSSSSLSSSSTQVTFRRGLTCCQSLYHGHVRSFMYFLQLRWTTTRAILCSWSLLNSFRDIIPLIQDCIHVMILPRRSSRMSSNSPRTPARKNTFVLPTRNFSGTNPTDSKIVPASFFSSLISATAFEFKILYLCLKSAYIRRLGKPFRQMRIPSSTPLQVS